MGLNKAITGPPNARVNRRLPVRPRREGTELHLLYKSCGFEFVLNAIQYFPCVEKYFLKCFKVGIV